MPCRRGRDSGATSWGKRATALTPGRPRRHPREARRGLPECVGAAEIAVSEVLGGESFLRARASLDGDRVHVVAWKHLLNPP